MSGRASVKVAQLSALPALLAIVAVCKTPRHARPPTPGTEPDTPAVVVPVERFFATGAAPSVPIDLRGVVAAVTSHAPGSWFQVTVIAELSDEAVSARVATEVEELLAAAAKHYEDTSSEEARARLRDAKSPAPLTPPEAAAFAKRGVRADVGVGWPGASADVRGAVLRVGRFLAVPGLKGDFASLRPNPLAAFLEAAGARVLVEGDPSGGASPVLDLTCEMPDEAKAAALARTLDHYLRAPGAFFLRPPWHPRRVSADEDRARATYLAIDRAVKRSLTDRKLYDAISDRVRWNMHDPTEMTRAVEEVRREFALKALETAAKRPDADSVVVEEMRKAHAGPGGFNLDPLTRRRLAERLGSLAIEVVAARAPGAVATVEPTADERGFGATGRVQVQGKRVGLGRLVFHRVAHGLPALLAQLDAAGAGAAKLAVTREPPERHPPFPTDLYDPEGD